ncbi:hypothetical protein D3C85_1268350 [compost metagenome]
MLKPNFLLTHKIPIIIQRRETGSYVEGDWVEGSLVDVPVEINIQPLKPHEILQLPESERTRVWYKFYTASYVRTEKEGNNGWDADEFNWKGDRYKVMKVDDWLGAEQILEHCKALCVRLELTPN